MTNSTIAKNMFALYVRMILRVAVTLYTSRVVLQILGIEDFGIYNLVGGISVFLAFYSSSLSNAVQRYLSIGIGHKDIEETKIYFRQSVSLLFVFSALVLFFGETVGLWFVMNELVIPTARLEATFWVYQCTLVLVISSILQISFIGMIVAYEKMTIYAYLGLFEAFAILGVAIALKWLPCDHLVLYAVMIMAISIITLMLYMGYCYRKFPGSCSMKWYFEKRLTIEMIRFIGYNIFGCFAWSAASSGIDVILNLFFGPITNGARGIATQVGGAISRFIESIMTAVKPQIIMSCANGNNDYMIFLMEKSSKFAFFVLLVLSIPVMFNTDYILQLWLGSVPLYAVPFIQLTLVATFVEAFYQPLWIVANGTGDIKNFQIYSRCCTLATVPISYLLLRLNINVYIPLAVYAIMQIVGCLYAIVNIKIQIGVSIKSYFTHVFIPSVVVAIAMILGGYFADIVVKIVNFWHFLWRCTIIELCGCGMMYLILSDGEKKIIKDIINKKFTLKK